MNGKTRFFRTVCQVANLAEILAAGVFTITVIKESGDNIKWLVDKSSIDMEQNTCYCSPAKCVKLGQQFDLLPHTA